VAGLLLRLEDFSAAAHDIRFSCRADEDHALGGAANPPDANALSEKFQRIESEGLPGMWVTHITTRSRDLALHRAVAKNHEELSAAGAEVHVHHIGAQELYVQVLAVGLQLGGVEGVVGGQEEQALANAANPRCRCPLQRRQSAPVELQRPSLVVDGEALPILLTPGCRVIRCTGHDAQSVGGDLTRAKVL